MNPYDPGKELVDVIDDEGHTVGVVTRREMRVAHCRIVAFMCWSSTGPASCSSLRTASKDVYPSFWDPVVGGVVTAGESFAQGACREVREELGIDAVPQELFPFRFANDKSSLQGVVYRLEHEGPFTLQPEEIVRGEFVPPAEIDERARQQPFCPDGLKVLAELRRRYPVAFQVTS